MKKQQIVKLARMKTVKWHGENGQCENEEQDGDIEVKWKVEGM